MSSYLISFVKDLLENADANSRDRRKQELEQTYHDTGKRVDELLTSKYEQLSKVVHAYSVISQKIKASRSGILKVKEDLHSCKELLDCKRDELRQPWLDHVRNSRVVELVEKIDAVRDAPDRIQVLIGKKYYGRATELLLNAETALWNELNPVTALHAVRTELTLKKKSLYLAVEDELKRQIYLRSTDDMFSRFQRSESQRLSTNTGRSSGRSWQHSGVSWTRAVDTASLSSSGTAGGGGGIGASDPLSRWQEIDINTQSFVEDEATNPEVNRARLLLVLVEAAHRLGLLPRLVGSLKNSLPIEVGKVVQRAYNEVVNSAAAFGDYSPLSNITHPRYLVEFVEMLCEVMVVIVHAHHVVLRKIGAIQKANQREYGELHADYDSLFVWSTIQNELQSILEENLDMRHGNNPVGESGQSLELKSMDINRIDLKAMDLNVMFGKKRFGPRIKRESTVLKAAEILKRLAPTPFQLIPSADLSLNSLPLFSFAASVEGRSFRENRHNIAETTDFNPEQDATGDGSRDLLLCRPCHTNIQAIYVPLFDFLKTIEREMSTEQCHLRQFVVEFIEKNYLEEVKVNLLKRIEQNRVDFKETVDTKTLKDLNLNRPILKCALTMSNCLLEVKGLARSLPDYAGQCLDIAFLILDKYKEMLNSYQREHVRVRYSPSGPWSEDPDVVRLLKSFPSYRRMLAAHASETNVEDVDEPAYSEQESRQRAALESKQILDMLDAEWPVLVKERQNEEAAELLHRPETLVEMAHHHESLTWLYSQIGQLHAWLEQTLQEENSRISSNAASHLAADCQEFRDRADAALIMIRLESRVRAYFYFHKKPREYEERYHCRGRAAIEAMIPLRVLKRTFKRVKATYYCRLDDKDTDEYISIFVRDLHNVSDKLTAALPVHKTRYIFEGLGHIISRLLISTLEHITRVNDSGVKKMSRNIFAVYQVLANLTHGQESELQRTKQIYESLMTPPETLLTGIMEHGVKYDLEIYSQILQIYQRSHPTKSRRVLEEYEKRLRDYCSMAHV